jgi:hypothetical protein
MSGATPLLVYAFMASTGTASLHNLAVYTPVLHTTDTFRFFKKLSSFAVLLHL